MPILKAEKKEPLKFIGAFLSPHTQQYLLMYSLAKGVTKTTIIRKLIEDWMEKEQVDFPIDQLILLVAHRGKLQWKTEKSLTPNSEFFLFKKKFEQELRSKGVDEKYIQTILNELCNG